MLAVPAFPYPFDRVTQGSSDNDTAEAITERDGDQDPTLPMERRRWKDSQVEKQDGCLCEAD